MSIFYFLARDGAASKLIAVKIWESKGMPLRVALSRRPTFRRRSSTRPGAKAKQDGYEAVTSNCNRIPIVTASYVQVQEW